MAKVPENLNNKEKCLCPDCPSFPLGSLKDEILFCGTGRSECEIEKNGCLCISCPVAQKYNLSETYYCQQGAVEQ